MPELLPSFPKQNRDTFNYGINPKEINYDGISIKCQLAILGNNPNERNIREIVLEKPKFEDGDVDQFFKKNEASFTENTVKPTDPPKFLNTTLQQINPRFDHETENDSKTTTPSSTPLEISPHLHRRVDEIVRIINGYIGPTM